MADKLNIIVCVIVIYICIYNAFAKYYQFYLQNNSFCIIIILILIDIEIILPAQNSITNNI